MKRTDLEKLKGLKIKGSLRDAATPGRYGKDANTVAARRERRKLDQARGLVPFAVKLDGELAARLHALAADQRVELDAVVDELLRKGLGD